MFCVVKNVSAGFYQSLEMLTVSITQATVGIACQRELKREKNGMTAKRRYRAIAKVRKSLLTFKRNRFVDIMCAFGGKGNLSKDDIKHYEWRKSYGK